MKATKNSDHTKNHDTVGFTNDDIEVDGDLEDEPQSPSKVIEEETFNVNINESSTSGLQGRTPREPVKVPRNTKYVVPSQSSAKSQPLESKKRKRSLSRTSKRFEELLDEDPEKIDNSKIQLSWFDSDLHLNINRSNYIEATPISHRILGVSWAGVRANFGAIENGKYFYEVLLSNSPNTGYRQNNFRCGWSVPTSEDFKLGEYKNSIGIDTHGRVWSNKNYSEVTGKHSIHKLCVIGVHLVSFF